ncbi:MAG: aminodeoxychorismate synthase component I [Bacteroidales bacterium]
MKIQIRIWCMRKSQFIENCNAWAEEGTSFLFMIDYELEQFLIFRPEEAAGQGIFYNINGRTNYSGAGVGISRKQMSESGRGTGAGAPQGGRNGVLPGLSVEPGPGSRDAEPPDMWATAPPKFRFEAVPMAFPRYEKAFSLVKKHILHGNSFLLNLTFPTPVETDLGLEQIFHASAAPYRLLFGDRFVVFSPETFVTIGGNTIRSFPMKGTIDAALPDAERRLLENEKELWEHNTIVDLIRNDLSMVAADVQVARFRYIDRIRTHQGELLQVSSEIEGRLGSGWRSGLGELLLRMLPAGSISGAPKLKTVEIIAEAEGQKRGFFTGIFGIFDGEAVDSAVMIRYIERVGTGKDVGNASGKTTGKQASGRKTNRGKANGGLQFRSGGGITGHSEAAAEYREMIEKVYVPIVRS